MSAHTPAPQDWADAGTVVPAEHCPAWNQWGVQHAFAIRQPGVTVDTERAEAVERLAPAHAALRHELGVAGRFFCTAQQVHGAEVAVVSADAAVEYPGVDALVTASARVCLGIYTADCGAVFLVEPKRRVIGLAHAGVKGTRAGVVDATLRCMRAQFGCEPGQIKALLSPCIRPPLYEWDFAAEICQQLATAGVEEVRDAGVCTGANTRSYYSYRVEKGRTGRMLALLALC